jgi:SAM-dependent methyltransferase
MRTATNRSIRIENPIGRLLVGLANKLYEKGVDIPRETRVCQFWIDQGTHYMEDQTTLPERKKLGLKKQEEALVEFLKDLRFRNILEVGCGYGRILKLVGDSFDARLVGIDLSRDQLTRVRGYVRGRGVDLSQQIISNLAYADETFDIVFSCNVLLHVPPNKLRRALGEMTRVSKRHIVLMEPYKGDNADFRRSFCWDHDYAAYFSKLEIASIEQRKVQMEEKGFNRIIHVEKRTSP